MARPSIVALALALIAGTASAQSVNPPGPLTKAMPGLSGKAALGYLATSGNTDSTNANASLDVVYQLESWQHKFDLSAIFASSADITTAESYKADYQAERNIGERGYGFAALDWNRDRFSGYERQASATVGYGRRFIDTPKQSLSADLGVGKRESVPLGAPRESDTIGRASLDYVYKLSDTSEFDQTLVAESGSTNTSAESVTSLKANMFGNVNLVLAYRLKYNSNVAPGVVNSDRFTSVALEYDF